MSTATSIDTSLLDLLLRARRIAVVGAREESAWTDSVLRSLSGVEDQNILFVSKTRSTILGRPTVASLGQLEDDPPQVVVVLVGAAHVLDVLDEASAVGARLAIVLASGFAETGAEGSERQRRLREIADRSGMRVMGPNSVGGYDFVTRRGVYAQPAPASIRPGSLALVSQSGGMANALLTAFDAHGIGISHVVCTGNEAQVNSVDVIEAELDERDTNCIGVFVESVADADRLMDVAGKAIEVGKPIVVLKSGESSKGARLAQAHTGALAVDRRVTTDVLRQGGIVQVDSLEQFVATAGFLSVIGQLPPGDVAFVSGSGGRCNLLADHASDSGLELADVSAATRQRLEAVLGRSLDVANPLDVTGQFLSEPGIVREAITALLDDEDVSAVVTGFGFPVPGAPATPVLESIFRDIQRLDGRDGKRVVPMHTVFGDTLSDEQRADPSLDFPYVLPGVLHGVGAMADAVAWSARRKRLLQAATRREAEPAPPADVLAAREAAVREIAALPRGQAISEWTARTALREYGLVFPEGVLTNSPDDAAAVAERIGFPVVLKLSDRSIMHKSDVAALSLGVADADEARREFDRLREVSEDCGEPGGFEGVMVVEQLAAPGVDLLIAVSEVSGWGHVLTIASGGVLTELVGDAVHRRLPADRDSIDEALTEIKAGGLLDGYRGLGPLDRGALIDAIVALGAFATDVGDQLQTVEINPLRVTADGAFALDSALEIHPGPVPRQTGETP